MIRGSIGAETRLRSKWYRLLAPRSGTLMITATLTSTKVVGVRFYDDTPVTKPGLPPVPIAGIAPYSETRSMSSRVGKGVYYVEAYCSLCILRADFELNVRFEPAPVVMRPTRSPVQRAPVSTPRPKPHPTLPATPPPPAEEVLAEPSPDMALTMRNGTNTIRVGRGSGRHWQWMRLASPTDAYLKLEVTTNGSPARIDLYDGAGMKRLDSVVVTSSRSIRRPIRSGSVLVRVVAEDRAPAEIVVNVVLRPKSADAGFIRKNQ